MLPLQQHVERVDLLDSSQFNKIWDYLLNHHKSTIHTLALLFTLLNSILFSIHLGLDLANKTVHQLRFLFPAKPGANRHTNHNFQQYNNDIDMTLNQMYRKQHIRIRRNKHTFALTRQTRIQTQTRTWTWMQAAASHQLAVSSQCWHTHVPTRTHKLCSKH